ncbi:hypothetical protein Cgig2_020081 [Carnegiea gigantea]|uniref:Fe2OG dioxygenase domain-containing protein n=1 Tax=Carnegiea gigantea TaxID=171969 RepID=A0A9Q1KFK6_9CARY|nr:hypothetical protein Cgig2_020081 [Carnegiea gigantea]
MNLKSQNSRPLHYITTSAHQSQINPNYKNDYPQMGEVDPAFIQAIEHRPRPTIIEANEIPVLDLSPISSLDHLPKNHAISKDMVDLISEVAEASEKWGFFQVINHGVPPDKLEKLELIARKFFALPLEEKKKVSRDEGNPLGYYDAEHTKNVRDWKEVFDFTVRDPTVIPVSPDKLEAQLLVNRWPDYPTELREVAQEYAQEVEKLAFKLLELIALSLGLSADRLNGFFKDHTSFIRLNHYPPCPAPQLALGVGRHKDVGALTILAQDGVGGLEVRQKSNGEWVRVKPTPGAFIINVGDIIQVWSNDKYESVEHRVMVNSQKDRLSIPFFFNPAHYVNLKPLEELLNEHNRAKFREYNWGEFFAIRKQSNFKKLNVENIQISHFRITE